MKNIFNKIFNISQQSKGIIDDDDRVIIDELISYDLVINPGFENSKFDIIDAQSKSIYEFYKRKQLLEKRKEKIKKLNNL